MTRRMEKGAGKKDFRARCAVRDRARTGPEFRSAFASASLSEDCKRPYSHRCPFFSILSPFSFHGEDAALGTGA